MSKMPNITTNTAFNLTSTEEQHILDVPSAIQLFVVFTICLGAFLLNFTVFYTLPHLHGKINSSTRCAMLNLAVTDAILGCSGFIGRIIYLVDPQLFFNHICFVDGIINALLAIMSAFGLMFLNMDKFLSLKYPMWYKVWMTRRKAIGVFIGMWVVFLALTALTLGRGYLKVDYIENTFLCFLYSPGDDTSTLVAIIIRFFLLQGIPFIICMVTVIGMYHILKKHEHLAKKLKEGQNIVSKNDYAVVYTIFALNFIYFVMITPFFVCVSVWKYVTGSTLGPVANFVTVWIGAANSAVNPLIYIPSMRSYRKELGKGFLKLCSMGNCSKREMMTGSSSSTKNSNMSNNI